MNRSNNSQGQNYQRPPNTIRNGAQNSSKNGTPNGMRRNAPSQPPKQQQPPKQPQKSPGIDIYIVIELLLLVLSVTTAILLCSFLSVEYHFEYVDTPTPVRASLLLPDEPSEKIYEREIPQKNEPKKPEKLPEYDFSAPVPECDAYPVNYFDDTVFIGDSRTAGLILYSKLSPIDYSATGFNIKNLKTKAFLTHVDENGEKSLVTIYEALQLAAGTYKAVYLSTGVNELGWNVSSFISAYRDAIDSIREITDVPIYIQLILPVTTEYAQNSTGGITNDKQVQFNEKLLALAKEEKLFILDPLPLFSLEDGSLDPEVSFDGAHLQKFACKELLEYYQTHVVDIYAFSNTFPTGEPDNSKVFSKVN